ncbi:MAG: FAD-binding domain-containing protein [Bacteroidota bacterium]
MRRRYEASARKRSRWQPYRISARYKRVRLPPINIVWLKRDLRLRDHEPLHLAARADIPCLLVYCFEPSLVAHPDYSARHWRFAWEGLQDMNKRLAQPVLVAHEECLTVFQRVAKHYEIVHLWSHLEIGVKATFERDKAVKRWCLDQGIVYQEFGQDGVRRGAKNRIGWEDHLAAHLQRPALPSVEAKLTQVKLPDDLVKETIGQALPAVWTTPNPNFQPGGATYAWRYFQSFLQKRHRNYSRQLGKPSLSRYSCSRLSPYLAFGNISWRELVQTSVQYAEKIGEDFNLPNFQSRLYWRAHYLQKMESGYHLEYRAINPALEDVGRSHPPELWRAYAAARTGFPMVDASLRCLAENGWINFRMRAMLVTFATFTLGLDWRAVAHHLAPLFLDFEPAIHYAQHQMQAGLTGYHTLRIFNPNVQAEQHDPQGEFIHRWLPALRTVPPPACWQPWKMTPMEQTFYHCEIGKDYPAPIVDYDQVTKHNKDTYWAYRQSAAAKAELPAIWERFCIPTDIRKYQAAQDS